MALIAMALDMLQGEKDVHLSLLLPIVTSILTKLDALKTKADGSLLEYYDSLFNYLQDSIPYWKKLHLLQQAWLSATFDPPFPIGTAFDSTLDLPSTT